MCRRSVVILKLFCSLSFFCIFLAFYLYKKAEQTETRHLKTMRRSKAEVECYISAVQSASPSLKEVSFT